MQKIFQYRKIIGLTVLISTFLLCLPQSPVQAAMIASEYFIHQGSKQLSDRARVRAFFTRMDVMAQMQAYGISCEEAPSRVDSLTDSEIALIAGKLDQIPAGAGIVYSADGSFLFFVGVALYAIFMAIVLWFSFTAEKEKKPLIFGLDWQMTAPIAGTISRKYCRRCLTNFI